MQKLIAFLCLMVAAHGLSAQCTNVTVTITTDCWGEETGFYLQNIEGTETIGEVFTSALESESTYTYDYCLEDGCYNLVVTDNYGDGMNGSADPGCDVDGLYELTNDEGTVLVAMEDSNFGNIVYNSFCIGPAPGCTDPEACNFIPWATEDDGSCLYGDCTDPAACNYNSEAICENGSCTYPGCTDVSACNYDSEAGCDNSWCTYTGLLPEYPELCLTPSQCLDPALAGLGTEVSCAFPPVLEADPSCWEAPIGAVGEVCDVNQWLALATEAFMNYTDESCPATMNHPWLGQLLPHEPVDRFFDVVPDECGGYSATFNPPASWIFESFEVTGIGAIAPGDVLPLTPFNSYYTSWEFTGINGPYSGYVSQLELLVSFSFYNGCDPEDTALHTYEHVFVWEEIDFDHQDPQLICGISVGESGYNQISWVENGTAAEYNIYEIVNLEAPLEEQLLLGTVPSGSGLYEDVLSNPQARSYRYAVQSMDACGRASTEVMDLAHLSIHLSANQGINGEVNLAWNNYEGAEFDYTSFEVYRSTDGQPGELIASLPNFITAYTDNEPPSGSNEYRVEVTRTAACAANPGLLAATNSFSSNRLTVDFGQSFCGAGTVWDPDLEQCVVAPQPSGCTYAQALNYDPAAVLDNGTCTFNIGPVGCSAYDFNADGVIGAPDILAVLGAYGTVCE
ncbi:MAG: hypothetical protein ACON34_09975 [Flavobacteriales bacterium]